MARPVLSCCQLGCVLTVVSLPLIYCVCCDCCVCVLAPFIVGDGINKWRRSSLGQRRFPPSMPASCHCVINRPAGRPANWPPKFKRTCCSGRLSHSSHRQAGGRRSRSGYDGQNNKPNTPTSTIVVVVVVVARNCISLAPPRALKRLATSSERPASPTGCRRRWPPDANTDGCLCLSLWLLQRASGNGQRRRLRSRLAQQVGLPCNETHTIPCQPPHSSAGQWKWIKEYRSD